MVVLALLLLHHLFSLQTAVTGDGNANISRLLCLVGVQLAATASVVTHVQAHVGGVPLQVDHRVLVLRSTPAILPA